MRKILSIVLLLSAAWAMVSCSENEETSTEYDNWQVRNDEYFKKIYQMAKDNITADSLAGVESDWMIIHKFSAGDSTKITNNIVVKIMEPQTDPTDETVPLSTDTISVYYAGYLMPSDSCNTRPYACYPTNVGKNFDKSWYDKYDPETMLPSKLLCSGMVTGFETATEKMHKGERWMVYIPYILGYDGTARTNVPAYSTLIFDITMVNFWHPAVQK